MQSTLHKTSWDVARHAYLAGATLLDAHRLRHALHDAAGRVVAGKALREGGTHSSTQVLQALHQLASSATCIPHKGAQGRRKRGTVGGCLGCMALLQEGLVLQQQAGHLLL